MSTFAQVIGGLFGLVLAAYAIIDPKLKEIGSKDQRATDYVYLLRKEYYENIIILSIMCFITILSCIATINLYEVLSDKLFSVLVNQATLCGVISMISFLYFGCSLLNPNAIVKFGEEERKEIEDNYDYRKSNHEVFSLLYLPFAH